MGIDMSDLVLEIPGTMDFAYMYLTYLPSGIAPNT